MKVAALIRGGQLCKGCGNTCKDDESEKLIDCPTCLGAGCDQCNDGWIEIKGCPQQQCSGIGQVCQLIDLFNKGLPPVAGGALDQTQWFVNAVQYLATEEAKVKADGREC